MCIYAMSSMYVMPLHACQVYVCTRVHATFEYSHGARTCVKGNESHCEASGHSRRSAEPMGCSIVAIHGDNTHERRNCKKACLLTLRHRLATALCTRVHATFECCMTITACSYLVEGGASALELQRSLPTTVQTCPQATRRTAEESDVEQCKCGRA